MAAMSVPAAAQGNTAGESRNKNTITANPFLLLFSWWNVEYERVIAPNSTIGLAGSYSSFEDDESDFDGAESKYYSGYLLYRLYPSGKAPAGFYFGGRLGITSVEIDYYNDDEFNVDEEGTTYGFGLEVGYTWLLGDNENFVISVGAGATRLFGGDLEDDTVGFLPIIRLVNIGAAF
jgi:hypothetical protein